MSASAGLRRGIGKPGRRVLPSSYCTASAAQCWIGKLTWPLFAERHRVFAIDMLGFGADRQALAGETYTVPRLARFALDFLSAQAIPRAHVAGFSLGGPDCARCALMAPDSCRLIVARCTGRDRASRCAHPVSSGEHFLGRRNALAAESRPNARLLAAGLRGPVVCDGGVSRTQGRPCRPARCAAAFSENAAQRPRPLRNPARTSRLCMPRCRRRRRRPSLSGARRTSSFRSRITRPCSACFRTRGPNCTILVGICRKSNVRHASIRRRWISGASLIGATPWADG